MHHHSYGSNSRKAAFLDRDGVINVDFGYVSCWEDFEFIPGAIDGMRMLQDLGYLLVVITNQSGIARGYFNVDDYQKLTNHFQMYLSKCGVQLTGIYHCPHHPRFLRSEDPNPCNCRKPAPGLILQAQNDFMISLSQSILVGDQRSDIEAGSAAGVGTCFLINKQAERVSSLSDRLKQADSLLSCARYIDSIRESLL